MPRRIGLIAAWVMVTLVAVAIAAQAVGSVRDQVTNRPSPIVDVSALAPTTTPAAIEPTTTTVVDDLVSDDLGTGDVVHHVDDVR